MLVPWDDGYWLVTQNNQKIFDEAPIEADDRIDQPNNATGREGGRQAGRQSKPGGRFRKECNLPTGSVAYSIVYSWCLSQDRKKKG